MFKKISQSLLEGKPEKALIAKLESSQLENSEERQELLSYILEHQQELSEGEAYKAISNLILLLEIHYSAESPLKDGVANILLNHCNQPTDNFSKQCSDAISQLKEKSDKSVLIELLRFCQDPELISKGIKSLDPTNEEQKSLLLDSHSEATQGALLDSIKNIPTLKELEKDSRDKGKKTHRLILQKIEQLEEHEKQVQQKLEKREQIIESLRKLASSSYAPLYDSKLIHLKQEWQSYSQQNPELSTEIKQEANSLIDLSQSKVDAIAEKEAKEEQASQNASFLESSLNNLKAFLCAEEIDLEACESLITSIKAKLDDSPQDFNKELFNYYEQIYIFEQGLALKTEEEHGLQKQFEVLTELFSSNQKRKKAQDETATQLQRLHESYKAELNTYPKLKSNKVESAGYKAITSTLSSLNHLLQQHGNMQKEFLSKFDKKTSYIKTELENKELSTVYRLCKEAEELIPYSPVGEREKLNERLQKHKEEFKSLEDWYNYATLPKRKELCEAMESLAKEAPRKKIKLLKEQIKDLQKQWKDLGHARDKEGEALWDRFQELGNKAYEPVKNLVERKEAEKDANLKKREEILRTLEAKKADIKNNIESSEKLLRSSQNQWKRAFPIPGGQQALQNAFDEVCKEFVNALKPSRKVNLGKKNALLSDAQKLLQLDDNRKAIQEAKRLQAEWKEVGYCEEEESLWKQFREACDQIFGQRDKLRDQQKGDEKQAIDKAKSICREIENLQADSASAFKSQLKRLSKDFNEIKNLPPKRKDLRNQFQQAEKRAKKNLKVLISEESQKSFANLLEVVKSVGEIEKKILAGDNSIGELDKEMNAVLIEYSFSDEIKKQLSKSVIALSKQKPEQQQSFIGSKIDQLRQESVSLEIELDVESPEEDKALRMELQVQRLNQKFNKKSEELSLQTRIEQAMCIGGLASYQSDYALQRLVNLNKQANQ